MKEATGPEEVSLAPDAHLLRPVLDFARTEPSRPLLSRRIGNRFVPLVASEVEQSVRHLARGLIALGVEAGQRVALMSNSRVEWALLDYAILAAGAVTVPIYPTSSAEQVAWILQDSGAVLAVFETEAMRSLYQQVASRLPDCRATLVIQEGALNELSGRGGEVEAARVDERLSRLRTSDLATILYTSGTTGRPKGCPLTHGNLRVNAQQVVRHVGDMIRGSDRTLLFLPLAHSLAKIIFLLAMEHGMEMCFATSLASMAEELPLARPDWMVAVPRVFEKVFNGAQQRARQEGREHAFNLAADVAERFSVERTRGSPSLKLRILHAVFDPLVYRKLRAAFGGKLRFAVSGGGPLGERLTRFFDGVGVKVLEGYGLSETSPVLNLNTERVWRIGSVGRVLPGTSTRIAHDGEILVRGPQVFQGYWHDEEATREAFTADGWFRTGDLGTLDEDGFLHITGRKKEILVTAAGKNVAPAPLEDVIRSHPLVSQAMVVGDGKPFVAALVTLDAEAYATWAREHGKAGRRIEEMVEDPELRAEIGQAIEAANRTVSRAESIRKFVILPRDFIEGEELTPTQKVKRSIVARRHAALIAELYEEWPPRPDHPAPPAAHP